MVSLFGTASETCLEIADRAPYACCVRCRCARGRRARRWASALHARSCRGLDTLGRRAPAVVQHAANDALGICHQWSLRTAFQSPSASKNTPVRVRSAASNWRASTRSAPSSASVWREVKRRLGFLLLRAGGLKGDGVDCHIACPSPWHVATSVGRPATSSPTASPSPMSQIDVEVDVDRAARQAIDGVVVRR